MRISPSVQKTLRSVQTGITDIRNALAALSAPRTDLQELTRSIRDAQETDNLQDAEIQEQLVSLRAKELVRQAGERYARKYQQKNYRVQKWLAFGTWGAFIAAGIYAGFAWQTMKEIERQTKATESASAAATQSVNIASAALQQNQRQFESTLKEMKEQTVTQDKASQASLASAITAKEALHVSERAYLVRALIETDLIHKVLTVNVQNVGHIPTGDIHVVAHLAIGQQAPGAPEGRAMILEATKTESDFPSFPPGAPQPIKFTPRSWDPNFYKMGAQGMVIVMTLTYNEGFPDEPDRTLTICAKSAYLSDSHD